MDVLIQRALHDLGAGKLAAARLAQRPAEIDPVEAHDHVGFAQRLGCTAADVKARRERMQRVPGGKARSGLDVGERKRADALGQRDAALEVGGIVADAADQEERPFGSAQPLRDCGHGFVGRRGRGWHGKPVERRHRLRGGQRFFLEAGIESDVHGTLRRRLRDVPRAQYGFQCGLHRSRLVVPFGVVTNQRGHVAGGVDPVDPRPALHGIDRPDAAQQQHGNSIAPCIEDRHRCVHQTDVRVQRDSQRPSRHARIAVRERHRMFLVDAQQQLRTLVAEIVDQAVVQAAIARAGRERDVGDFQRAQHLRHRVAAPCGGASHRFACRRSLNIGHEIVDCSPETPHYALDFR